MKKKILMIVTFLLTLATNGGQCVTSYSQGLGVPLFELGKYDYYEGKYPKVFINIDYKGTVPVFSKPDGGVLIANLRNNQKEGIYYNLFLLRKRQDKFLAAIFDASEEDLFIAYGWVDKKYLGIYVRNYSQPLILFANPADDSDELFTISEYYPEIVQITAFYKLWIKVEFYVNKKFVYGWIPYEMQCSNVWTTCC